MHIPKETYVIGCFENCKLVSTPTHVRPILAERRGRKFRRLFCYSGEVDFWSPIPQADFLPLEEVLRFSDFVMIEPKPYRENHHVVLFKNGNVFVGNKFLLVLRLVPKLAARERKVVWRTILNIFT